MEYSYFQVLRQNSMFSDISESELKELINLSEQLDIKKDTTFIQEGEIAESFYIILVGEVLITKFDKLHKRHHIIADLHSGDSIGELALIDQKPRSASAQALTDVKVLSIPFKTLKTFADKNSTFNQIFLRLAENLSNRVRHTNDAVVQALQKQLQEYKIRHVMGIYLIYIIIGLCIFSIGLNWILTLKAASSTTTIVSLPLTFFCFFLLYLAIKTSHLPLSFFGFTTQNWRQSIIESIGFSLILFVVIFFVKLIVIHTIEAFKGRPLFEFSSMIHVHSSTFSAKSIWLICLISYWLLVSPLQEIIARGGIQGPLERFLTGKYTAIKAIFLSNLLFATTHIYISSYIAFLVFVAGLYFGWLYHRHHNLIGVTIAHALVGTWAIFIMGVGFFS